MNDKRSKAPPRDARRAVRLNALLIAAGSFGILAIASFLTPDPRGFGTHEQLGLPPCISTQFFGVPCPLCGMTTSFALMAHARPIDALRAQPAGAVFFWVCVAVLAAALVSLLRGRVPLFVAALISGRWIAIAVLVLVAGAWVYKIIEKTWG